MAVGTPVCPRAGGVPEFIEDGFNGLMFLPADTGAIADAILHVLKNEQLARRLRENGIKTRASSVGKPPLCGPSESTRKYVKQQRMPCTSF